MSKESVRNDINTYVKENGRNEITGPSLNGILNEMLDELPTIDTELSTTSENPVQNRVVSSKLIELDTRVTTLENSGSGSMVEYGNTFAEALTDTPTEQTFKSRTTAGGATIKKGVAFVDKVFGNTIVENETLISNTNKEIKSYTSNNALLDSLNIDTSTIKDSQGNAVFPLGLLSAGSVRDEVDLARGKAIKRIGVVDLGTATFKYIANTYFNTQLPIDAKTGSLDNSTPCLCPIYATEKPGVVVSTSSQKDKIIGMGATTIVIKDKTFSDPVEIKSSLVGIPLYYELATPIEYDLPISKAFYKVDNGGTEEAISEGASAPLVANIGYQGTTESQALNLL